MHITINGCVAIQFKMLTYYVYAPLLNRIDALPLNAIYNFEIASSRAPLYSDSTRPGIPLPVGAAQIFVCLRTRNYLINPQQAC